MDSFSCATQIISGPGSLRKLGQLGIQKAMVVSDPYFVEKGTARHLAELSGAKTWEIFGKVTPDPSAELAAEGTAALKKFQPDTLIALGGGSAMDCAKAMAYFANDPVRLVMVPTTSGSGSEVTDFAVLTHNGIKHPLVDEKLRPAVAILDSELLRSLPKTLIADAGFDVLSHAMEAYVAKGATTFTDALAKDAFAAAFSLLPASYAGRWEVRQRIHEAATMAGMAFTRAGLGLCHALAHTLGGAFHVPHGRLNAILLPAVLERNSHMCAAKYASLARAAGLGSSADTLAVRNLKNGLIRLRRELGLPGTLREAGIDPRQVWYSASTLVKDTLADPCCRDNPLSVEDFMVKSILEEVSGRGE